MGIFFCRFMQPVERGFVMAGQYWLFSSILRILVIICQSKCSFSFTIYILYTVFMSCLFQNSGQCSFCYNHSALDWEEVF